MSTTKDMEPEQITNTEDLNIASGESSTPTTPKVKNPKKVKAGNALARKNAEAKKFYEKKNEEDEAGGAGKVTNLDASTIYNGILSTAGLVGAGFTLYYGWKFYETYDWNRHNDSLGSLRDKFIPSKPKVKEVEEVKEVKEVKKSKSVTPLVSQPLRG